jgi:hypothetical protein
MDAFLGEWLVLAMNAFLIALLLVVPVLGGVFVLRIFRRGVSEERHDFEAEVMSKLGELAAAQEQITRQLEDLAKE